MLIFVNFQPTASPSGGGNQFIKNLIKYFTQKNIITNNLNEADIILFNSHHNVKDLYKYKQLNPNLKFAHRVDGPHLWRTDNTDKDVFYYNRMFANGTIFQSQYSKTQTIQCGFVFNNPSTIIPNAVDADIFYPPKLLEKLEGAQKKIRIISSSWSDNILKGFNYYKKLDKKLDFNKYEMFFIGRSPIQFHNIQHISPQPSQTLSDWLRTGDIFLTASQDDPASNSVLEALACGLPIVYLDSGGHKEIVKEGGEGFLTIDECMSAIDKVSLGLDGYKEKINIETIESVGNKYMEFFESLCQK